MVSIVLTSCPDFTVRVSELKRLVECFGSAVGKYLTVCADVIYSVLCLDREKKLVIAGMSEWELNQ